VYIGNAVIYKNKNEKKLIACAQTNAFEKRLTLTCGPFG